MPVEITCCGFSWHCQYAIGRGAGTVVGVNISEKMLTAVKEKTENMCRK